MNRAQNTHLEKSAYRAAAAFIALYIGLAGCAGIPAPSTQDADSAENAVTYVTPQAVHDMQQKNWIVLLIDTGNAEPRQGRIPGALHVSDIELEKFAAPMGAHVVFYHSGFGNDAARAAAAKVPKGDFSVAVMEGGQLAWIRAGYPITEQSADMDAPVGVASAALRRAIRDEDKFLLVDLRDSHAFARSRIDGALNLTADKVRAESAKWPKDRWIVFYDKYEQPAQAIADEIQRRGFRYTGYLAGGYDVWLKESATKKN